MSATTRAFFERLLLAADIRIGGDRPWDIRVHDERLFRRVLLGGELGLGEAYMDGWWDCDRLDQFFDRLLRADVQKSVRFAPPTIVTTALAALMNKQSRARAFQIGEAHYDLGNDLYEAMLDRRMTYTCGYWKNAATLDEAQEAKLDLVCRKLGLKSGQTVLDIGCGWGSFMQFAAEKYGARATGITVSREQAALARERCKGFPIELIVQDYRETVGTFDRVVSLGMFEHVGAKNHRTYMRIARRCLKDDGLFLLHTIGNIVSTGSYDPWMEKYIFPNSVLPSLAQISRATEGLFVIEDVHNFGMDYDKTLMAWHDNFERHWPSLVATYGERFHRMWRYYLLMCAGVFRSRYTQLWQIVLSPRGVPGGYVSVR